MQCWLNASIGKCDDLRSGGGQPDTKTKHPLLPSSTAFYSLTCFSCLLSLSLPTFAYICFLSY